MKHDYTKGSLVKNIFLLGLPMTIEMVLLSTYSLVDLYFISYLGNNAIAGVGLASGVLAIPISISMGLGNAYYMLITRRIGEKNLPGACAVIGQALWLSAIIGLLVGIIGYMTAAPSIRWLGGTPAVVVCGSEYLRPRHLGLFIANVLFCFNSCLRGAGNAKTAMLIMVSTNIFNIIIDPLLIFGWWKIPSFGIKGASYATIISHSLGLLLQIIILIKGTDRLKLTARSIQFHFATTKQILRLAYYTIPHNFLRLSSMLFLNLLVAYYGTVQIAAFTITIRLHMLVCLPALGIATAAGTLVGQNLGAKQPERAKKTIAIAVFYCLIYMAVAASFMLFMGPHFFSFMNAGPEVLKKGMVCLYFFIASYPLLAVNTVISFAFIGGGDPKTPLKLDIFNRWLCRIFLGFCLSRLLQLGAIGIWVAILSAESLQAIVSYILYKKDRWLRIRL